LQQQATDTPVGPTEQRQTIEAIVHPRQTLTAIAKETFQAPTPTNTPGALTLSPLEQTGTSFASTVNAVTDAANTQDAATNQLSTIMAIVNTQFTATSQEATSGSSTVSFNYTVNAIMNQTLGRHGYTDSPYRHTHPV
jgi:hypothetical protein